MIDEFAIDRSSKKGDQWYLAGVTSDSVHDATVMDRLICDDDAAVYGDKGYASGAWKRAAEAAGVLWAVKEKSTPAN